MRGSVIGGPNADVQPPVEQRHFDILGAVREEVQMQMGVQRSAAIEHWPDQMRLERGQYLHPFNGQQP